MAEYLGWEDYLTIGIYFVLVIGVGLWSTCRSNKGSAHGYFLAGKNMHWIPVGASIFASNIGAPMFIGIAGSAAASGIAVIIYEWIAVYFLVLLGWIFVPVYTSCGAFTTPGYLRKRYGGKRIRIYSSIFALIGFVLFNISIEIYSGGVFLKQLLGWNMYLCVVIILFVTAVYTIVGGLTSVIYTDTLQTVVLISGSIVLFVLSYSEVGGWDGLQDKYMKAAANETLINATLYGCGLPREDSFTILRSPLTGDIPWTGSIFGLSTLGLYVWCHDQLIVQRCLAAKSISHAKAGSLLGACLKILPFFLYLIPGMVSRILYPEEVACADPETCSRVCGNPAGCSNMAYPLMVLRFLPSGLRGLMLAALIAALMSSMTSILNSASSIVTLDIWCVARKRASEMELMIVGRITVLVLVATSILWLPILEKVQGGMFWFYMQSIRSYLIPPWCILFMLGVFWKRTTEAGGFWGLILSLVVGIVRMVLDFTFTSPLCGSGKPDERPSVIANVDFLHFAIILAVFTTICMVVISLQTEPRPGRKLRRVTWWTRHDKQLPDPDTDEEEEEESQNEPRERGRMIDSNQIEEETIGDNTFGIQLPESEATANRCKTVCMKWICGTTGENANQSAWEAEDIRKQQEKDQSLDENPFWRRVLNISAVIIIITTTVLIAYFN
ncbi:sodium/glucose cotransporter 4-like [Pecten maximus]|uniref:sodium/glucose cotransporter 4-like n=1 Tax=Pecten maximus TaxID=6579 RepID=UPI00145866C1|nr:sodium/glucose cotransporter 4-like [Pecten maximus]